MRGHPLIHLAITAYKGHHWAVSRIPYNYNGNCAYANGFPVLTEEFELRHTKNFLCKRQYMLWGGGRSLVGRISEVIRHPGARGGGAYKDVRMWGVGGNGLIGRR